MLLAVVVSVIAVGQAADLPWWPAEGVAAQLEYEAALNAVPDAPRLARWHEALAAEPHVAGTPGDERVVGFIAESFEAMGLRVERHDFVAWLPLPVSGAVQIVGPTLLDLPVKERALPGDPFTAHDDLAIGWNAYSGSGDVTGEVVYANYGTGEDFRRLGDLGVNVAGRIVIARYGRNFRGYKAKFAQAAGAAGLILYTDPDDSGWRKGIPYPEGGWANEHSIQRGSIITLDYPGDPLTPFAGADEGADRLDPADVALPAIPVQPVGWAAAAEIMSRMDGPVVPDGWQGGLPFAYRVTGGPALRVRVAVRQEAALRRSANVIATLPGATEPEHLVVIGCHHDAWGFGAADPLAGTIVLMECARSFAEAARLGRPPDRTIVFAAWGAEEFGIVGSVEWCEAHRDELSAGAVAYVNLDMAAMGLDFGASAAPALKRVIASAAHAVPQARGTAGQSALDRWAAGAGHGPEALPPFGNLGGGSDHIGFYCHLGIPSCGLSAGGSPGTAYHSNYDTLTWYRRVVGDDYEPALMLARVTNVLAARLACAPLLPLHVPQYARDLRAHLEALRVRAETLGFAADLEALHRAVDEFEAVAAPIQQRLLAATAAGRLQPLTLDAINAELLAAERAWLHEPGLPQRPWFRNLYAASDPDSGYEAWMLPALRHSVEHRDATRLAEAQPLCLAAVRSMGDAMRRIDALVARDSRYPRF